MAASRIAHWTAAAAVAAFVAGAGCIAPTLPLPPPALPTVSAGGAPDTVRLSARNGAEPNAIIVVYNGSPGVPLERRVGGAQADGEGSWSAEVFARPGDQLDVTQETGTTRSAAVTVRVPAR